MTNEYQAPEGRDDEAANQPAIPLGPSANETPEVPTGQPAQGPEAPTMPGAGDPAPTAPYPSAPAPPPPPYGAVPAPAAPAYPSAPNPAAPPPPHQGVAWTPPAQAPDAVPGQPGGAAPWGSGLWATPPGGNWGPGGPGWAPPGYHWGPQPQPSQPSRRFSRAKAVTAGLAAAALVAGVGIGYAVGSPSSNNASSLSPSNGPNSNGGGFTFPGNGGNGNGGGQGPNFTFPGGQGSGSGSGSGGGTSNAQGGPSNVSAIANNVSPGLVDINTNIDFGAGEAAGTGMVLTSSGEVLTNNHVVNGATNISVTDVGNGKTYQASVVGYDRSQDVAVLQLKNASGLQTVNLGDSSKVSVGQAVVGIGNAGGTGGTPSAAGGSITALDQSITASDQMDNTSEQLTGLIQTNSNIQAGDSGGPLVDTSGQVIGMDTAASDTYTFQGGSGSGSEGFAIPINTAFSVAKQIEAGSTSSSIHLGDTGFLGVEVQPSGGNQGGIGNFGAGNGSGNGSGSSNGVAIVGTQPNTPAANAGLGQGDVITSVNGTPVNSPDDLTNVITKLHPGDKVTVDWTDSSGQQHSSTVTLATGPAA